MAIDPLLGHIFHFHNLEQLWNILEYCLVVIFIIDGYHSVIIYNDYSLPVDMCYLWELLFAHRVALTDQVTTQAS